MSTYNETCTNCNTKLIIDDNDSFAGGCRDNERIFCPNCHHELQPCYTSGIPRVYYDTVADAGK